MSERSFPLRDEAMLISTSTIGCATEVSGGRALSGGAKVASDMTLEYCASNCTGFQLFGVEYGEECEYNA